jgi:hypothetical protein
LRGAQLLCLGWDVGLSEGEAGSIQSRVLEVRKIQADTTLWLEDTTLDEQSSEGSSPEAGAEGAGCFIRVGDTWKQAAVQLDHSAANPSDRPSGTVWTRTASLTDSATRHWLLHSMMGHAPMLDITPSRGLNAIVRQDGGIALLWIDAAGIMMMAALNDPAHADTLGSPPGVEFVEQRPGAALYGDQIMVVAYGNDQQLWYRLLGVATEIDWHVVASAVAPKSGAAIVNVDGTVHLFAVGPSAELREATFAGTWRNWKDLEGTCDGTPSASSWGPNRIDVALRCSDGHAWSRPWFNGYWLPWYHWASTSTEPLVIDAGNYEIDVFARDDAGNLTLNSFYWAEFNERFYLEVPSGRYLSGVSRFSGSYDLFLSDGNAITHVWWPR